MRSAWREQGQPSRRVLLSTMTVVGIVVASPTYAEAASPASPVSTVELRDLSAKCDSRGRLAVIFSVGDLPARFSPYVTLRGREIPFDASWRLDFRYDRGAVLLRYRRRVAVTGVCDGRRAFPGSRLVVKYCEGVPSPAGAEPACAVRTVSVRSGRVRRAQ